MWTTENRRRHDRSGLRYESDLTDAEWALTAPLIPPAKRGGHKRMVATREVVSALMYVLSTGCQWRALRKDRPDRSTVYDDFNLWDDDGTLTCIHHALFVRCRETAAREASPTAAIIDTRTSSGPRTTTHGASSTSFGVAWRSTSSAPSGAACRSGSPSRPTTTAARTCTAVSRATTTTGPT